MASSHTSVVATECRIADFYRAAVRSPAVGNCTTAKLRGRLHRPQFAVTQNSRRMHRPLRLRIPANSHRCLPGEETAEDSRPAELASTCPTSADRSGTETPSVLMTEVV